MLFLSATPLMYSEEIEDLLSLLWFESRYGERDEFESVMTLTQQIESNNKHHSVPSFVMSCLVQFPKLKPDPETIIDVCRGKVFFIPESMGTDMPSMSFQGVSY